MNIMETQSSRKTFCHTGPSGFHIDNFNKPNQIFRGPNYFSFTKYSKSATPMFCQQHSLEVANRVTESGSYEITRES